MTNTLTQGLEQRYQHYKQIIEHVTQKDYKNLQGRSVILDCVALDETGKQFDIEVQQEN